MKGFTLNELIELYDSVGLETRNMKFLANWYCEMFSFAHLPSIDDKYKEQLVLDKLKLSIFNILADDLADNSKLRDKNLFDAASNIPRNSDVEYENEYLEAARRIWLDFLKHIKQYPRYEEFKDLFFFDLVQFFDSMKYSMLVNTMGIDNTQETRMYLPHNMQVILFLDLDLMCSPNFDKEELGKIRSIFLWSQDLLHLAHVISTYPREIQELDFSSPMISIGINEGVIKKDDVIKNPRKTYKKLKYYETFIKRQAEEQLEKIKDQANVIKSVDINDFHFRVKKVYEAFLQRQHYWNFDKIEEGKEIIEPVTTIMTNYTPLN